MAIVEIHARNVYYYVFITFIFILFVMNFLIKTDDPCWNNPCEGCLPSAENSHNYTCCGEKSLGLYCENSSKFRNYLQLYPYL
jgi:hypothetical protein